MSTSQPIPPFLKPNFVFPETAEAYALALLFDSSIPGDPGQPYAASQFWYLDGGQWNSLPVGAPAAGIIAQLANKPFHFVALDVAAPTTPVNLSYWLITRWNSLDISQPFLEQLPVSGNNPAPWNKTAPGPIPGGTCYLLTTGTFRDAASLANSMLYYRISVQGQINGVTYVFSHDPEMEMDPGVN